MARSELLLVIPPERGLVEGFSAGVVSLANFVSSRAPEVGVRLLDLGLSGATSDLEIAKTLKSVGGQLFVGITTTTATYQSALRIARAFKANRPSCVLILGGHHASAQDQVVLRAHDYVDIVVRGEGEIALLELIRRYPDLSLVPGVSYREDGAVKRNAPAPPLDTSQLDALSPNFHGLGLRSAAGKLGHVTYVSARGCHLKCAFCAVANDPIRGKSIDAIIKDFRYLVGHLGLQRIAFEDNFFAHSPKRTIAVCDALAKLRNELAFTWDCQTRVESMRRDKVVKAMERGGCDGVYLGVEALTAKELLYLGKTTKPDLYLNMLEQDVLPLLLESRIETYLLLQVGFPEENDDCRTETINALQRLGTLAYRAGKKITVFPHLHVIYPGTIHSANAQREKVFGELGDNVFESFTVWEARHEPILNWMGRHFGHGVGGIPVGILNREVLSKFGDFQINSDMIIKINNYLHRLERIMGVHIFNYSPLLVQDTPLFVADAARESKPTNRDNATDMGYLRAATYRATSG
jgi:radical SAM superfamily enzyme YgiQ (UPF0313 family)